MINKLLSLFIVLPKINFYNYNESLETIFKHKRSNDSLQYDIENNIIERYYF